MVFLILLALAFGGSLAFFLVLVGLFEAPWPLLLAGLLLAFFSLQRLSVQAEKEAIALEPSPAAQAGRSQAEGKPRQPPMAQPMGDELVYRGIRYTHVEPAEKKNFATDSVVVEGTYRGHQWKSVQPTQPAQKADVSDEIIYRGCKVKKSNSQAT